MTTGNKLQWLLRLTAGAAMIALAAGCQPDKGVDPNAHGEDFIPPDAERALNEFSLRQAGNAARADETLRAYHFDDRDLNSLGEKRLDSMLYWRESPAPLVVYLDLPADDAKTAGRRETVIAFLKDRRLAADQIELRSGPNPDWNSPVAPILAAQQGAVGGPAGARRPRPCPPGPENNRPLITIRCAPRLVFRSGETRGGSASPGQVSTCPGCVAHEALIISITIEEGDVYLYDFGEESVKVLNAMAGKDFAMTRDTPDL